MRRTFIIKLSPAFDLYVERQCNFYVSSVLDSNLFLYTRIIKFQVIAIYCTVFMLHYFVKRILLAQQDHKITESCIFL